MPDPISFTRFRTTGVQDMMDTLVKVYRLALVQGMDDVGDGALTIIEGLLEDVNQVAIKSAADTDALIIRKMLETQSRNRPTTHAMELHVLSKAGMVGMVYVALTSELDKIINPRGYGPFWRAQEYGTGSSEVKSQLGRTISGVFQPSGEAPDTAQAGLGVGQDQSFQSTRDAGSGRGVISVELPGRHFLAEGAAEGAELFLAAMGAVEHRWAAQIRGLREKVAAHGVDRRYRYVLRS